MYRPSSRTNSVPFESKAYLSHLMGLTALLAWKSRWDRVSGAVAFKGPLLVAQLLASQRFALGFPVAKQKKYGRNPFLAVQNDEEQFIKRMAWSQAWLDETNRRLILVSQKVMGDGENLEDLPAMGLVLTVDASEKLEWLGRKPVLEARSLWFDEEGHHVGAGLPLASWPLRRWTSDQALFPEGALSQERNLREILEDKIQRNNRSIEEKIQQANGSYLPYGGRAPNISSDFQDLVAPFQADRIIKVRPSDD